MATTQPSLAAVARKYGVATSASLDPYEEPHVNADDRAAIQEWLDYVERTMKEHRSPFIAAEVLLKEMDQFAESRLDRPERLYIATALPVLLHCLPCLTPEHGPILSAAVHELAPAVAFTRTQQQSISSRAVGAEMVQRIPYAECFWRVYGLFVQHRRTIEVHDRRAEVEAAVMDRVVFSLDRLWVKMCFLSWRVHCRRIREKKLLFRKLAHRGLAGHIVPQYIRAWRQHAHSVMMAAKIARSSEVTKELEALFAQEQDAKSLHERTNEEVREKMRLLKEETARVDQLRARLGAVQALHEDTEQSLHSHWRTWHACMTAMFGDSHPIDKVLEDDSTNNVTYQQNITDTAELYSKRARARTGKVGLKQIQACLRSQGNLEEDEDEAADDDGEAEERSRDSHKASPLSGNGGQHDVVVGKPLSGVPAPPRSPAPAPLTKVAPKRKKARRDRRTTYVWCPPEPVSVDATIAALNQACFPVVSPLRLIDLLRASQAHINVALSFISCMYSGGHCSLFWPPRPLRGSSAAARLVALPSPVMAVGPPSSPAFSPAECAEPRGAASGRDAQGPGEGGDTIPPPIPADVGAHMLEDVNRGMAHVESISEGNDRHLLSIRRCLQSNPVDEVQGFLGCVFARGSTMGLPLDREKVESALVSLVRPVDGPVIQALYPSRGIRTFTEFSEYLAKIAEFTSIPLVDIAERLENGYVPSPREEMLYILHTSEDIRQVMREAHTYVARLLEWAKDEQHPDQIGKDKAMHLLMRVLDLPEKWAEEVWSGAGSEVDIVAKDDLIEVLYLAAGFLDPSPFTSPAEKIAVVLDLCVPFLADL